MSNSYFYCTIWVVCFLCVACSGPKSLDSAAGDGPESTQEVSTTEDVTEFMDGVLSDPSNLTAAEVVTQLGNPIRVRVEPMPSAGDSMRTMIYYGLEVVLHESAAPSPSRVAQLALTDARHIGPSGLRIGIAEDHILRALGRPTRQTPSELFYEKTDPTPMVLVIFLERNAASRIEWRLQE